MIIMLTFTSRSRRSQSWGPKYVFFHFDIHVVFFHEMCFKFALMENVNRLSELISDVCFKSKEPEVLMQLLYRFRDESIEHLWCHNCYHISTGSILFKLVLLTSKNSKSPWSIFWPFSWFDLVDFSALLVIYIYIYIYMKSLFPKGAKSIFTDIDFFYTNRWSVHMCIQWAIPVFIFFLSKTEKYGSQFFVYFQKALNPISFVSKRR